MLSLEELRKRVESAPRTGRGRRFSSALKSEIVAWASQARSQGATIAVVEADIGVSWNLIARWANLQSNKTRVARVEIVPSPSSRAVLVSPSGWRIEGLSLEQVRGLVVG